MRCVVGSHCPVSEAIVSDVLLYYQYIKQVQNKFSGSCLSNQIISEGLTDGWRCNPGHREHVELSFFFGILDKMIYLLIQKIIIWFIDNENMYELQPCRAPSLTPSQPSCCSLIYSRLDYLTGWNLIWSQSWSNIIVWLFSSSQQFKTPKYYILYDIWQTKSSHLWSWNRRIFHIFARKIDDELIITAVTTDCFYSA